MKNRFVFPNLLWVALNLTIVVFHFWVAISITLNLFGIRVDHFLPAQDDEPFSTDLVVFLAGVTVVIISTSAYILWMMRQRWCHLWFRDNHLTIFRPLTGTYKDFQYSEIRGYSISQVCLRSSLGRDNEGAIWCSDTVVVYTGSKEAYELVKIYNLGFRNIEHQLNAKGITSFGFEPYDEKGFYRRRYEFYNGR